MIHRLNNKRLLIILIPLTIAIMLILISVFFISTEDSDLKQKLSQSPTEYLTQQTVPTNGFPLRKMDYKESADGHNKLIDRLKNPVPLTINDQNIKKQVIAEVGGKAATLNETKSYKIMYLPAGDEFLVAIKDINILTAKQEVKSWFISKGFTQNAMCDLPVSFFLDNLVVEQLKGLDITFNPIMEGC